MLTSEYITPVSFQDYLEDFKKGLKTAFYEIDNIEIFTQSRGFPKLVLDKIMSYTPLSVAIPSQYGGRGAKVKECLGVLAAASYESLPLSLTFGINIALFLEPVAKYGQEEIKQGIFDRFLQQQNMGGLMITEPDYGSDALNMKTSNVKIGDHYHIKGTKHWQGLTGMADYWLMTSRHKSESGRLGRDIDFFICDEHQDDQKIIVEEIFNNIGLYPIPYGTNIVDIKIPEKYKLVPESTGLKLMMDLLHRSRLQFPGMAMGFLKRMLDEAIKQCTTRYVGGKPLWELDQVKHQIAQVQSAYTISSAMCHTSCKFSSIDNNVAGNAIEANSMKAYITDLMQSASQIVTQLGGANGYKIEKVAARGMVDSRPFRVFEGSNEMLFTQIAEMVVKKMERSKVMNLWKYLLTYAPSERAADFFKNLLNFELQANLSQRKLVDLGNIIARVITANQVMDLGDAGFRSDLITNCLGTLKQELTSLLSTFSGHSAIMPIEDYQDKSSWMSFS